MVVLLSTMLHGLNAQRGRRAQRRPAAAAGATGIPARSPDDVVSVGIVAAPDYLFDGSDEQEPDHLCPAGTEIRSFAVVREMRLQETKSVTFHGGGCEAVHQFIFGAPLASWTAVSPSRPGCSHPAPQKTPAPPAFRSEPPSHSAENPGSTRSSSSRPSSFPLRAGYGGEPALVTAGNDLGGIAQFLPPERDSYPNSFTVLCSDVNGHSTWPAGAAAERGWPSAECCLAQRTTLPRPA
jgi:hypothetical protein